MQRGEEEKVKNGDEVHFPRLREKYRSDPGSVYERCAFQEDLLHILIHILPISHPEFEPLIYIRQIKMPIYIYILCEEESVIKGQETHEVIKCLT